MKADFSMFFQCFIIGGEAGGMSNGNRYIKEDADFSMFFQCFIIGGEADCCCTGIVK